MSSSYWGPAGETLSRWRRRSRGTASDLDHRMKWGFGHFPDIVLERRTTFPDGAHDAVQLRLADLAQDCDLTEAIAEVPDLLEIQPGNVVAFRVAASTGLDALSLADMLVVVPPRAPSMAAAARHDPLFTEYAPAWSAAFGGLEDRAVYINAETQACVPLRRGHRVYAVVPRPGPSEEAPIPTFVRTFASWNFFLNDMLDRTIGLTTPRTACDWVYDSTGATDDPTATFSEFDKAQLPNLLVEWLRNERGYFDLRELALDILEGRRDGTVDCREEWGWENAEFKLTLDLTHGEQQQLAALLRA